MVPIWTNPNGPDLDPDVVIRASPELFPWFKEVRKSFVHKESADSMNAVLMVVRFCEMFQLRHWYRAWDGDFEEVLQECIEQFKKLKPLEIEDIISVRFTEQAMKIAGWVNSKMTTPIVTVGETQCYVLAEHYSRGGRMALELYCLSNGEPYTRATSNVLGVALEDDEVLVKDYSENAGVLKALVDGGVVLPPTEEVPAGFDKLYRCRVNREKYPGLV